MASKTIISGVVLIDKPQGMTSQQVVSKVKYLLKSDGHDSKKAGHTGTLDPMATGLLPICLGEATKFSHYQLDAVKSYQAIVKLGEQTDTGDAEGHIIATCPVLDISASCLATVTRQFLGEQLQTPPMYSALKKDGKKLYELARAGIKIARDARPITIAELTIQAISATSLQLDVTCSKGTYVRVLGEDIAKALGTVGHLTALRRTQTGHFSLKSAITLADFEHLSHQQRLDTLLSVDACVTQLPKLVLDHEQSLRILQGQRLNVKSNALSQNVLPHLITEIRLFNPQQQFLGVANLESSGRLQPIKLIKLA